VKEIQREIEKAREKKERERDDEKLKE